MEDPNNPPATTPNQVPLTAHTFKLGDRTEFTLEIPFSEDEIAHLERAYGLQAAVGLVSAPIRELLASRPIPWGYSLLNRQETLEDINGLLIKMDATLNDPESTVYGEAALTQLREIRANLAQVGRSQSIGPAIASTPNV